MNNHMLSAALLLWIYAWKRLVCAVLGHNKIMNIEMTQLYKKKVETAYIDNLVWGKGMIELNPDNEDYIKRIWFTCSRCNKELNHASE